MVWGSKVNGKAINPMSAERSHEVCVCVCVCVCVKVSVYLRICVRSPAGEHA
jgi:hypothetical protein